MSVDRVDTSYLETLVGYNARRAAVTIIEVFLQRMAVYGLRPVDFSVPTTPASHRGRGAPPWAFCLPTWWAWWVPWRNGA